MKNDKKIEIRFLYKIIVTNKPHSKKLSACKSSEYYLFTCESPK